jgi:hypothetical protein
MCTKLYAKQKTRSKNTSNNEEQVHSKLERQDRLYAPRKQQPATIKQTIMDELMNQVGEFSVGSSEQNSKTKQGIAITTLKAPAKSTVRAIARAGGTLKSASIRDYISLLSGATEVLDESVDDFINNKESSKKHGTNSKINNSSNTSNSNNSKTSMKKGDRNDEQKGNEVKNNYYGALEDLEDDSEDYGEMELEQVGRDIELEVLNEDVVSTEGLTEDAAENFEGLDEDAE